MLTQLQSRYTPHSGINVGVRSLIFGLFSSGYVLIKGSMFINFFNFFIFSIFFLTFFPSAMYKKIKLSVTLKRGLGLFKGLCLLFLPNVPGATVIQGGTFIPDSRVVSAETILFRIWPYVL